MLHDKIETGKGISFLGLSCEARINAAKRVGAIMEQWLCNEIMVIISLVVFLLCRHDRKAPWVTADLYFIRTPQSMKSMVLWELLCQSTGVEEPGEQPAKILLKLGSCRQKLDSQS